MYSFELSRRQFGIGAAAGLTSLISVILTGCRRHHDHTLTCRHQRVEETYVTLPVATNTEISLSWIHSIELTRWTDTFVVTAQGLLLKKTAFSSYGAGMPLDEGTIRHENGQVIIDDIDRPMDAIRWIHSHDAQYRVSVNGDENLIDATTLPDHEQLEIALL